MKSIITFNLCLLLISFIAHASKLDVKFHLYDKIKDERKIEINRAVNIKLGENTIIKDQDIKIEFIVDEQEEYAKIDIKLYNNEILLSEPMILAKWDSPATIKIGNKSKDQIVEFVLEITASKTI